MRPRTLTSSLQSVFLSSWRISVAFPELHGLKGGGEVGGVPRQAHPHILASESYCGGRSVSSAWDDVGGGGQKTRLHVEVIAKYL